MPITPALLLTPALALSLTTASLTSASLTTGLPATATLPTTVTTEGRGTTAHQDVARPVRLRIPSIAVDSRIIPLPLDRHGRLVAPKGYHVTGWNVAGPEPGEPGAAVIAGHVDSKTGPAVFHRLPKLTKGAKIHVTRADGTTVTFKVTKTARYPKNRLPSTKVYGGARTPELRLITCGGAFDRTRGSYRDNIVVFAR
ncbi:class F sortase [Nonomuraea sp. NPDC050310]|uniref:class F sortase n=1 Tax=Nonomuraea sp. NPDC050310 TaxID=3154935 RepID=UPI0033EC5780